MADMTDPKALASTKPSSMSLRDVLGTSIDTMNAGLGGFLVGLGLPTRELLAPLDERRTVIEQFESAIAVLTPDDRARAAYLSKYCVAISVGLFDAALNFLWDETVVALRRHVVAFDLHYFFDIAEKREDHRKQLKNAEDLTRIDDSVLIDCCARLGLINDVNRERLRHINYMRNHASAAHPNSAELNGAEMISWLTNCLRYAISAQPDRRAVEIKRLLDNIRTNVIPATQAPLIVGGLANMPQSVVDDVLHTIFGMFTDPRVGSPARENISALALGVWKLASEGRRHDVGGRAGQFSRHGETDRVIHANTFLGVCGGLSYRSEDVLTLELLEKLRALRAAHFSWNNFYLEWPHAASLASSLPVNGRIPQPVLYEFVKTIGVCAMGNGKGYRGGVDTAAMPHYTSYMERFADREIVEFVRCFADDEFTVDLFAETPDARARQLLVYFRSKTSNILIQRAIDIIHAHPARLLSKVGIVTGYRDAVLALPAFP
jgi:hypothetical protein